MRILLILLVIIAVFVVVQAQRHGCKYDATLINCVLGKAETPTAETPPPPPPPPAETPAPAEGRHQLSKLRFGHCKAKPRAPGGVRGLFNCGRRRFAQRIGKISVRGSLNLHLVYRGHLRPRH